MPCFFPTVCTLDVGKGCSELGFELWSVLKRKDKDFDLISQNGADVVYVAFVCREEESVVIRAFPSLSSVRKRDEQMGAWYFDESQ
ncbi:hypothetical protein SLEP1_g45314 [Rubroshorea leprosula]|uniref:Uncharacterized protein n=1 Tax=Rubroshorea leprosula TaxID=152421 RepID=A0AAV5LKB4_9ROSI|nr:hypothetical protein SLEP1_g45314 [Rubroshorea leprosula]